MPGRRVGMCQRDLPAIRPATRQAIYLLRHRHRAIALRIALPHFSLLGARHAELEWRVYGEHSPMICPRKILPIGLALVAGLLAAKPAPVASQQPQQPEPPPTLGSPGRATQSGQSSQQGQPGQSSQADQAPPTIRVPVNLVVVPVTVKDSRNQLVGDLRRDEFRIFDDGVEQRITLFSVETAPLSVVIAVDNDLKPKTSD